MTPDLRLVSEWELRRMFNEGRYWERAQAGEFNVAIKKTPHANPDISGEIYCTHSQIIKYLDKASGDTVALVHQYLRPDGSIGGRGRRPDPKVLVVGHTVYRALPTEQNEGQ